MCSAQWRANEFCGLFFPVHRVRSIFKRRTAHHLRRMDGGHSGCKWMYCNDVLVATFKIVHLFQTSWFVWFYWIISTQWPYLFLRLRIRNRFHDTVVAIDFLLNPHTLRAWVVFSSLLGVGVGVALLFVDRGDRYCIGKFFLNKLVRPAAPQGHHERAKSDRTEWKQQKFFGELWVNFVGLWCLF